MRQEDFSTPHPVQVQAKVAAGEIRVTTVDGDRSTVTLEGPERLVDGITVELVGDRLVIEQRRKSVLGWFERSGESLQLRAHVPHRSTIDIATASADATLAGVFGGLETKSASGDTLVTGELDGDVLVNSVSGDVRLPRVTGSLTVQTVSGDVAAEAVDGAVAAKSVSGDVRVGSLREGQVNVQSVSGDVELGVASGTSIDVDARAASGELTSDIPLLETSGDDRGPTLTIRGNTVSGDWRLFRAA